MSDEIEIEGVSYISSKRASEISGYSQDYVGQLARGGYIDARRIGGLWHVSLTSLQTYEKNAEIAKSQQIAPRQTVEADSLINFDGKDYVSASRAAHLTGYHQDYVGQLARSGTIHSRQVGNRWYVQREAIIAHKSEKDRLLGALQSESVGIRVLPKKEATDDVDPFETIDSHFTYTQDESDLLPKTQGGVDYGSDEVEVPRASSYGERTIPIQVGRDPLIRYQYVDRRQRSNHLSRKSIFYWAFSLIAIVVIGVSVLIFSDGKNAQVYATDNGSIDQRSLLHANLANLLIVAGDFVEMLIVPELVYKRQ